jgi:predicted O-linked N-acetylglucosamine transferase (SPINDLY family)
MNHYDHLERLSHADLFIDTFNYNAHTTCSDALWSGVPVVTKKGNQFSSRVAASLLTSLGLEELITNTKNDYKDLILHLCFNSNKLLDIKKKLTKNILTFPLFNTKKYTENFETGLKKIYENRLNNLEDKDIEI